MRISSGYSEVDKGNKREKPEYIVFAIPTLYHIYCVMEDRENLIGSGYLTRREGDIIQVNLETCIHCYKNKKFTMTCRNLI